MSTPTSSSSSSSSRHSNNTSNNNNSGQCRPAAAADGYSSFCKDDANSITNISSVEDGMSVAPVVSADSLDDAYYHHHHPQQQQNSSQSQSQSHMEASSCTAQASSLLSVSAHQHPLEQQQQPSHLCNSNSSNNTNNNSSSAALLVVSVAEAMNPTRRTTMEDVCVIREAGQWGCHDEAVAYIGVYDGHGGREMVDFLQHSMHYHVAQELAALAASETHVNNSNHSTATANNEKNDHQRSSNATASVMQTGLERAFLMADIHAKQAGIKSSGATVAVCLIKRDESHVHITAANVGDSRIVLGQLQHQQQQPGSSSSSRRLTVDHRMDGCDSSNNNIPLLEVARIERAGGFLFKGRVCGVLAVTRSLGDQILKPYVTAHPAVCEVRLVVPNNHDSNNSSNSNRYFLIVACDGLWDVMTDDEAVQLVQDYCSSSSSNVGNDNCGGNDNDNNCGTDKSESTSKMATAADFLVEQSLRRGTADNVTVVVAWL